MALTLPYEFDTTSVVKTILRGILALLVVVILPGILYSLILSHNMVTAVQLLLIGGVIAIFGRVFFRNLTVSRGVITPEAVIVQPSRLYGMSLTGPVGTFPLREFKSVRVERIFGPLQTAQAPRWHERVSLMGTAGTPNIVIARTDLNAGITLGHELATVLNLPYLEEIANA